METERFETVIVGGGQAGLKVGYYLAKQRRSFVILDGNDRIGDSWRKRWDSLRLFTPARFSRLPGWKIPGPANAFLTKDEMGDYLEAYAARFGLPVRTGVHVESLAKNGIGFVVTAGDRRYEADNVVVATGAHRIPKTPTFASELDTRIIQVHSGEYRSPSQLREGGVLLVGAGNSGAEIAYELSVSRQTWISGKGTGQIPFKHGGRAARFIFPVVRFVGHNILTLRTPVGRKVRPKLIAKGAPLIRRRKKDLAAAGIERVPRVSGVRDGLPMLEDGRVMDVANVIWCTGFRPDFSWIDLDVFSADGEPLHDRGVVASEPGLYFNGLVFQYSASSDTLAGRGRDAEYIVKHILSRSMNGAPKTARVTAPAVR